MMETSQSDTHEEVKVTFYPELYLQRRVWILNFLRREGITRVLDVGCGEGALLNTLCQPAPWLTPPPSCILPASPTSSLSKPGTPPNSALDALPSPAYSCKEDDIPNLHLREIHGLDISGEDLVFAMEAAAPPERKVEEEDRSEMGMRLRALTAGVQRWESLTSKVWKGGLEVINEEFKDIECIVGMEVIEHLPHNILLAFAPVLLGVYHPKNLLVTTPSYTFNARFTSPDAPASARTGYKDPTGRTDRIFRHSDHKFEWTREEFQAWCQETAKEWGYEVNETSIGCAIEADPWQRELQGATQVAAFYKVDKMSDEEREERARRKLQELSVEGEEHQCLASYQHPASPSAKKPRSLEEIAKIAKARMEEYRLSFMRMEELWFEPEIAAMCGGWIEMLVRAVEESPDLNLKRDVDGVRKGRNMWNVELIGGVPNPFQPWGSKDIDDDISEDWTPRETPYTYSFEGFEASDVEESTGAEGDVSAASEDDEESDSEQIDWGTWTTTSVATEKVIDVKPTAEWGDEDSWGENWGIHIPRSAMSSTAGWDGDESEDTTS